MAETVGALIDKISILELKIFYMRAQTSRSDATPEHRAACRRRLGILKRQREDLSLELTDLLNDLVKGRARLKIYRQFKMYNDPAYRTS